MRPRGLKGRDSHPQVASLGDLPPEVRHRAADVGLSADESCRAGSAFVLDHTVVFAGSRWDGVTVLPLSTAIEGDRAVRDLAWRLIPPHLDMHTTVAAGQNQRGFFIRVAAGRRVELPLQACLFMGRDGLSQFVHNVLVAEPGSEVHLLTGCTSAQHVRTGVHVGVTEIYIREGATVTSTMIHRWGPDMDVHPRSAALVEAGGTFMSTFVSMGPVRSLDMNPIAVCAGRGAAARFSTVAAAGPGVTLDLGSQVVLAAPDSAAEILSRTVTTGGKVTARGRLVGKEAGVSGHLECRGLILSENGSIQAVPELLAQARDVRLTHEAAVGRIAQEEILYLESRGLTEQEATDAIVCGFLRLDLAHLPEGVREIVERAAKAE